MADQPIPFPSPREQQEPVTGSHSPARSFLLMESAHVCLSLAEDVAELREQMGTDGLDLDAFLDQIVKHARALTGSNGAAVALRQGTVILCRARCGETSPPLGAQLDADFGISGECLRTGKALRCEDSERDLRLDPEVCRRLGLRSIAVVPIFESTTVAGILEVFASLPYAFDDCHLEILQQLAELLTTVSGRLTQENQDTISEGILGPRSKARPEIPVAEVNSYASASHSERLRKWTAPIALRRYYAAAIAIFAPAGLLTKRLRKWTAPIASRQYYAAAIAIFAPAGQFTKRLRKWTAPIASRRYYAAAIAIFALAGLLTILRWKPWHRAERTVVPSTKTLPQAKTVPASAATMETRRRLNIAEPGAVGRNVTSQPAASPTPSDHSSQMEAQKVAWVQPMSGKDDIKDIIVVPSLSSQTRDRVGPANDPEPLAPIPLIGTTAGFGKDANVVDSALSVQANLPVRGSQGVTGGSLERKVQPTYPAQARSTRLQGQVVLQAVIDEVGEVRNLRTVSGDAILARAAIDAVRQWRYQPYRLNGQPVKMPTEITVNFTLP
jgi:TonB family protein